MPSSQVNRKLDFTSVIKHVIVKHVKDNQVIGLGSGRAMACLVRELGKKTLKKNLKFVVTSLQIGIEAEKAGLFVLDAPQTEQIDIVFDGADQIDANLFMIKGGGGALLREKILMYSARKVIILADSSKFVDQFTRSVPIEVSPFARTTVYRNLIGLASQIELRQSATGYPYFTDNGNIILDASFTSILNPEALEKELTCIPGIVEVGIFTRRAYRYYKASSEGLFNIIAFCKNGPYVISP
jgi:ribose 5-phosphate isomerase A